MAGGESSMFTDDERPPYNQDPSIVADGFSAVMEVLTRYGWVIVGVAAVGYLIWHRTTPILNKLVEDRQLASAKKGLDDDTVMDRQMRIEAHRAKLQEQHDRAAAIHAAKQAELAEKKRQERLEDWDRHQSGQGYRSKVKAPEDGTSTPQTLPKPAKKPLRDGYNALAGEAPSCGYRPGRRGPAGGG